MNKPLKKIYILNPNLKNLLGHYAQYILSIAKPLEHQGYQVEVFAHRNCKRELLEGLMLRNFFTKEIWESIPIIKKIRIGRRISFVYENLLFFLQIKSGLNPRLIEDQATIFFDMITYNQILAWGWWLKLIPKNKQINLILLFRYNSEWFDHWSGKFLTNYAFKELQYRSAKNPSINLCLCSDSHRLAKDYSRFTPMHIEVFPIPHTVSQYTKPKIDSEFITFSSLGDARDEKGFLEILEAINFLYKNKQFGKIRFLLQVNQGSIKPKIINAVNQLKALKLNNIKLIDDVLSRDDYYRNLYESDVILLPYWKSIYSSRTSGIFTEALAAGKPVIVTKDTWMSDQLLSYGSGLLCSDCNPLDLSQSILELQAHYDDYKEKAMNCKDLWTAQHNPDIFVAKMQRLIER